MLSNTRAENLEKIKRYGDSLDNPYFGRVDYIDNGKRETIYIGEEGIERDFDNIIVVNHNSPIASLFYQFTGGDGTCTYTTMDDTEEQIQY